MVGTIRNVSGARLVVVGTVFDVSYLWILVRGRADVSFQVSLIRFVTDVRDVILIDEVSSKSYLEEAAARDGCEDAGEVIVEVE